MEVSAWLFNTPKQPQEISCKCPKSGCHILGRARTGRDSCLYIRASQVFSTLTSCFIHIFYLKSKVDRSLEERNIETGKNQQPWIPLTQGLGRRNTVLVSSF